MATIQEYLSNLRWTNPGITYEQLYPMAQKDGYSLEDIATNINYLYNTPENVASLQKVIQSSGVSDPLYSSYMADTLSRKGITDVSQIQILPTGEVINKITAQPIFDPDLPGIGANRYAPNTFGGTTVGEGANRFLVTLDEKGNPKFSLGYYETSDKDKILKGLAVAGLLFGGYNLLSGLGGGTAAGAGAATASTAVPGTLFNAAVDSQLANLALGSEALAGYTAAGAIPTAVNIGGTLYSAGAPVSSLFNPAMDSQLANEAIAAAGGDPLAAYLDPSLTPGAVSGLPSGTSSIQKYLSNPKTLADLAKAGINLASLGGASNMFGAGNAEVGSIPTQGMPVNTPEYYQAVQGFLNQYLPSAMPNQAEYLASWYSGGTPTSVGGLMQPTVPPPPPVKMIPGLTEGQSARYAQLTPEQQAQYLALSGAYNAPGDAASDAALVREVMRSSGLDINAIASLAGVDPQMVTSYLGQEGLTPAQLAQYQSLGYGGQDIYKDLVGAYQAPGTVQENAQQVLQVMQENKLTPADLAIITGIPEKEINAYLAQATPETPSMMAGPIEVDTAPSAPTFTTQDIVNAYQQSVGSGTMSEAQFVQQAMNMGVSPSELLAAQSVLLGR